ncbi:MAG: thiamine-phosphate synthase family protein [Candidatus Asgardarchaeia archaeon]
MRLPCEIVVKEYLPFLRAYITRILTEEYQWTQNEIANALKITQASVSKYKTLLKKRETKIRSERIEKLAKFLAVKIANQTLTDEEFIEHVCRECYLMRAGGEICKTHKELIPSLNERLCRACLPTPISQKEIEDRLFVLQNIQAAIEMLKKSSGFAKVIPEVRSNLVMARKHPKSILDIAGIPGRITEYKGFAFPVGNPEYGASKHTASILLVINKHFENKAALLCIKYDEKIEKILKELKWKVLKIKRKGSSDLEFLKDLEEILKKTNDSPDAVVDLGGFGVEAVTYIVGEDAIDVAKKAITISEMY